VAAGLLAGAPARAQAQAGAAVVAAPDAGGGGLHRSPILYLDFSDGTESVTRAVTDSASHNRSAIGAVANYPAFEWDRFTSAPTDTRDTVVAAVAGLVDQAFSSYDIQIATTRPEAPGYTMVMIGGGPSLMGFPDRVAGVALLDCGNHEAENIAFAFSSSLDDVHSLWVTIAQEAAHTFGLEHTDDDRDVMYPRISSTQAAFIDDQATIISPYCGPLVQSSNQKLRQVLGDWDAAWGVKAVLGGAAAANVVPAPGGPTGEGGLAGTGCAVAPGRASGGPAAAVAMAALGLAGAILRRRARSGLRRRPSPPIRSGFRGETCPKRESTRSTSRP
jgi:hypothetical protein